MKMNTMKKALAALLAAATVASSVGMAGVQALTITPNDLLTSTASSSTVEVTASAGYAEGAYAE